MKTKQAIIVRKDVPMSTGKIAGQVAHASLKSYENTDNNLKEHWNNTDYTKIILQCPDLETIYEIEEKANNLNISSFIVHDLGRTQIPRDSVTGIAIGPDINERINQVTGDLKLL